MNYWIMNNKIISPYDCIKEGQPYFRKHDRRGKVWIAPKSSYVKEDDILCRTMDPDEYITEDGQRVEIIFQNDDKEIKTKYQTFNTFAFKQALNNGVVHFIFKKVSGELREAYGTTNIDILRANKARTLVSGKRYGNAVPYYDMVSRGWRSFKPDNLIKIIEDTNTYNKKFNNKN